jgi:hypothetical protein
VKRNPDKLALREKILQLQEQGMSYWHKGVGSQYLVKKRQSVLGWRLLFLAQIRTLV